MLPIDWLISAALATGIGFWWATGLPARRRIVVVASLVALVLGVVAVMDHRWQAVGAIAVSLFLLLAALLGKLREGKKPLRVPYVSGSLLTILGVAAFGLLFVFVVTTLPAPTGEHPVGVRDFDLADDTRMGVLAAGDDEPRRLLVRIWYPAGDVTGLTPRPYFDDREAVTTATGLGSTLGMPFFFQYLKHSSTNSHENAPLLDGAANQPVVIYSHGYTSFLGQNTVLLEELASHGYIVYSVQHTYDSSPVAFPNGDVAQMDPTLITEMLEQAAEMPEEQVMGFIGPTFDERRQATKGQLRASNGGRTAHRLRERRRLAGGPHLRPQPARGRRGAGGRGRHRRRGRSLLGRRDRHVLRRLDHGRRLHGGSALRGRGQPGRR